MLMPTLRALTGSRPMSEIDDHFARLSKHDRATVAECVARIDAKLEARAKLADSLMTILTPHIVKLIKEHQK
jgi:hypothetical protein